MLFENPTALLTSKLSILSDIKISDARESVANRFLFSVLSNDQFREWLRDYQRKLNAALSDTWNQKESQVRSFDLIALSRQSIMTEVTAALLKFGDQEILYNLLEHESLARSDSTSGPANVGTIPLVWIVLALALFVLAVGTVNVSAFDSDGITQVTLSPAELRSLSEQIVDTAKRYRAEGKLLPTT